ncbi:MAG: Spy/CpxP family protein refolding chaperone [Sulfuritalea sp.]|nr:Spy/CpxP family protein refolding chaperone [Sulfuritalea sp.]MDP1982288.1 Spy/CpxP family protein refolding chaperone [Sulfuritalea sp.]
MLAATGIGAGLVMAGGGACEHGPHMMRGAWGGDFQAMADRRLERLHTDLKLRSEQEAAWSEFRESVSGQAVRMGEKVKSWRDTAAAATTIDRLERAQKGLDGGRLALDQLTAATKRFYATLDKEQQTRFDEVTRRMSPRSRGWGSNPGRSS